MRTTGHAKLDYRRKGFAIVEGVFSPAECNVLRKEVARLEGAEELQPGDIVRVKAMAARQRAGISRAAAGDALFMLGDLTRYSDVLRLAVADARVTSLVQAALGARPRYHFSNLTHKAPRVGPRVGLHRDFLNRLMTQPESRYCRAVICLNGMSERNGGMLFRPRSHRVSDAWVRSGARRKTASRPLPRPVHCGAGAVIIFHPKVIHGSVPNRSAIPRSNLVVQYGAAYQRLIASQIERWTGHAPEELRF